MRYFICSNRPQNPANMMRIVSAHNSEGEARLELSKLRVLIPHKDFYIMSVIDKKDALKKGKSRYS